MPLLTVVENVNTGFGGLMTNIGIVSVAGTIIGVILEKSGAAYRMAEVVIMAVGVGAMTVSHVNESYFWVVFSGMKVTDTYKAQIMAILLQGVTTIIVTIILWLIFF